LKDCEENLEGRKNDLFVGLLELTLLWDPKESGGEAIKQNEILVVRWQYQR
jgi:hypothetical protein